VNRSKHSPKSQKRVKITNYQQNRPHQRYNPLNGEWVLVSPHRSRRPWIGKQETSPPEQRPPYDPDCYLCPGNKRAGGKKNPDYRQTFVFTNDFSALLPDSPQEEDFSRPYLQWQGVQGTCRVICFSPRHDLTLARMSKEEIREVVELWKAQTTELGKGYRWVQIFENKGEIMGCSNLHPHFQVWAGNWLPNEVRKEDTNQKKYFAENKGILLLDYLNDEISKKVRLVLENKDWAAVVPFWAVWPFETMILPKRHIFRLTDLSPSESDSLADILKRLLIKYDNLFKVSFPYTMGWHGAPTDKGDYQHWQLHAHFYPPLLRSAVIKKFMVGYEMLSQAQRDITAEVAADRLRKLSEIHYSFKSSE
jgi:UDPglucose--hexose-1-phosphate uridylyltransferase